VYIKIVMMLKVEFVIDRCWKSSYVFHRNGG